ncbi:methionine sulfoxide reductase [Paenibacillus sp. J31TS4]|uniref:peptide-methionine (S)-S-oxide reductase MsrA n=1 Tax=Paenibacillus sp. J31TS4 TaxID=2807195 RepID=UPI001B20E6CA|nr:peptide-methionine (S)-S-oxide reductase [Paenibacillus sp. J31TS4]GIP40182.1 methionine sulfoxide reductase [Paenibacillus sp. J31TS4]
MKVHEANDSQANEPGVTVERLETAALAMGCFWSPDALFGSLPGVVRTEVGFAGGTTAEPTYRQIGDHTETVRLWYDSAVVSFEELLEVFWSHHNPDNVNGYKDRQYQSIAFYGDERQREAIERVSKRRQSREGREPATERIRAGAFYPAEERHQKYYLKRHPDALARLGELYPTMEALTQGTLAARLNGLAKGFTNRSRILEELGQWEIAREQRELLEQLVREMRW